MKLTAKAIEHAKPGAKRREIPDAGCAGLYFLVQPSGARGWAMRYRYLGRSSKLTLGSYPALSLAEARIAATQALRDLAEGRDPAAARRSAKIAAAAAVPDTVANISAEYLRREGTKLRTLDQRVSALRRLILPKLGDRPIDSVERSDVIRLLDHIEDNNGPRAAHAALSLLRRIFHWHELRTDRFRSPIIAGMGRISEKERARSRVLTDDEIRAIWKATADPLDPFAALVRFLLLTSARRNEAAGIQWREVDAEGVWALPASRSKSKSEVVRPLSKMAQEVLAGLPRIDGCAHAFSGNGLTAFSNFSRPKATLDAASGVSGYRLHDLRRTARSLLSRVGINSDVSERCLGHVIGGVKGVYDRHRYIDEMRHAFEALSAQIETIINPPAGKVADMAAERSKRQR